MSGISINTIEISVKAETRKNALQKLSEIIAKEIHYSASSIFSLLLDKEYNAGSGIGNGVAIPQLKLSGLKRPFTALITLDKPIPFEAPDRKPVDIICVLLSPETDGSVHLCRLSSITRTLNDQDLCNRIRETKDIDMLRALLTTPEDLELAA